MVSFADSLDCVGVLARNVGTTRRVHGMSVVLPSCDSRLLLHCKANLAVWDSRDPTAAPPHVRMRAKQVNESSSECLKSDTLAGLRIGVPQVRISSMCREFR